VTASTGQGQEDNPGPDREQPGETQPSLTAGERRRGQQIVQSVGDAATLTGAAEPAAVVAVGRVTAQPAACPKAAAVK
jgi:hypothetical protein